MKRLKSAFNYINHKRYENPRLVATYTLLLVLVSLVLYWRFPNNIDAANFYGEDGSVYLQNILNKGWFEAAITPFNGYFIVGLYLICGLGWLINLFLGASLITLPVAFAAAAVLFMAAVISLPFLLFGKALGKVRMLLVVALSTLMPLPMSPHIVIGTIGNQKWIFLYLAFLLVLYRIINHQKLSKKKIAAIDITLLVSAYTNSVVYFLVPIILLPYVQGYWKKRSKIGLTKYIKKILSQTGFRSLVLMYLLLLPQVIYVLINGIPKLAGYLDTPFNPARAIELFVNRTYLFGATHFINSHLNNILAVSLFLFILYLGTMRLKGRERLIFLTGVYTAGVASLLFVINRPGVSDHFFNYKPSGSGPDQFFYAQTLVMYLPLVLVLGAFCLLLKNQILQRIVFILVVLIVLIGNIRSINIYGEQWRNASVFENDAGIFTDNALEACNQSTDEIEKVTVYPYKGGQFSIFAPRNQVCNEKLNDYQLSVANLGLELNNNDHLPVNSSQSFTQTFVATENNLEGIRIFISAFGKTHRSGVYSFKLYDETCSSLVRASDISTSIIDNSYYNIRFGPVSGSINKKYCFTVDPPVGSFDPIAIQRSKPDVYREGIYSENNKPLSTDVVFMPLFNNKK